MTRNYEFQNINSVHTSFYVRRREATDKLEEIIRSGSSSCVYGVARAGKSAFVHHCIAGLCEENDWIFKKVSFKGQGYFESQPEQSLTEQFKEKINYDDMFKGSKRLIIVVDEINKGLEMWDARQLIDFFLCCDELMSTNVQFVMVGQRHPKAWGADWPEIGNAFPALECFTDVEIKTFSEEELKEYCSHSKAPVNKKLMKEILEATGGLAGAVNVILQRYNQISKREKEMWSDWDFKIDQVVQNNLSKFGVGVLRGMKGVEERRRRENAGGRSRLDHGKCYMDNVFISDDGKGLSVGKRKYRITNKAAWDIVDNLLVAAKGALKKGDAKGKIKFDSKQKSLFRKGGAARFMKECVCIEKAKRTIVSAWIKSELL